MSSQRRHLDCPRRNSMPQGRPDLTRSPSSPAAQMQIEQPLQIRDGYDETVTTSDIVEQPRSAIEARLLATESRGLDERISSTLALRVIGMQTFSRRVEMCLRGQHRRGQRSRSRAAARSERQAS